MSENELKKKIDEVNVELCTLINDHQFNLQEHSIIKCSQKLDILIVAYLQTIS